METDTQLYSVTTVTIEASPSEIIRFCNRSENLVLNDDIYFSAPAALFDVTRERAAVESDEFVVANIPSDVGIMAQITGHMPYSRIDVTVIEYVLDSALEILDTRYIFRGLITTATPSLSAPYTTLVCRNPLYYLDVSVGVPCTEYCAASYFGEPLTCGAIVQHTPIYIDSVDLYNATIVDDQTGVTQYFWNKGYFEYLGTRIKIKFWQAGQVFQTSKPVPASSVGRQVELFSGCDRRLQTCRNIHNNEINFFALGHSMQDYDPGREERD